MVAVNAWSTIRVALQNFVATALGLADDRVIWANQAGASQPEYPYASLSVAGRRWLGSAELRKSSQVMRETVQIVTAADQVYTVSIAVESGALVAYTFDAGPGDTVTDIRDGLVAAIGSPAGITITPVSTDKIQIDGSTGSPHFHVEVGPDPDIVRTVDVKPIKETTTQNLEFVLRVDIRTSSTIPDADAGDLAERIPLAAQQTLASQTLRDAKVALWRVASSIDLTGLEGADTVSRHQIDLVFGVSPAAVETIDWFRTVTTTPTWS